MFSTTNIISNAIIFGVDNGLSSHADNCKNNVLVLGEGPTDDIDNSVGAAEKKFSIDFTKAKPKFCLSLNYNDDSSYLFVKGKIFIPLNLIMKM